MTYERAGLYSDAIAQQSLHGGNAMSSPVTLKSPIEAIWDNTTEAIAGWFRGPVDAVNLQIASVTIPEITIRGIDRSAENRAMQDAIKQRKILLASLALFGVGALLVMRRG